ncbi:MAG TPA: hypothetical protein VGE97_01875 [Nitrososphaera sp.]|jgi:hypothetical protein
MGPKNPDDTACKGSGADFSFRRQAISDLHNIAVTTERIVSAQTGRISQKCWFVILISGCMINVPYIKTKNMESSSKTTAIASK